MGVDKSRNVSGVPHPIIPPEVFLRGKRDTTGSSAQGLRLPFAHHYAIPEDHAGDTRHEKIARRYTHQVDDRTSTVIKDPQGGGHRARKSSLCGRSVEYWAKIGSEGACRVS